METSKLLTQSTDRNITIDILRGIGIIFVVLGHLNPGIYFTRFIYSFHMFLFFFISGTLYKKRNFDTFGCFSLKRTLRLLVPYFVWNILGILIDCVFISKSFNASNILKQVFFVGGGISWNSPIWFLLVLFEIEIIAFFTNRKIWSTIICLVVSVVLFIVLSVSSIILPLGFHLIPIGMLFFCLGQIFHSFVESIDIKIWQKLVIICLSLTINILLGTVFNETISVYHVIYFNYPFALIAGFFGIIAWYYLSSLISELCSASKIISMYGRHTLMIICTHYFVLMLLMFVSKRVADVDLWHDYSFIKGFVVGSTILICYYPIFLLYDWMIKKCNWIKYLL